MDEVTKRPTATEVDDYSEYKRLRKIYREGKHKLPGASPHPVKTEHVPVVRAAPPILPVQPPAANGAPKQTRQEPPGTSHRSMFRRPHFDMPELHPHEQPDVVSPRTVTNTDHFPLVPSKSGTLAIPARNEHRPHQQPGNESSPSGSQNHTSHNTTADSSERTGVSTESHIREVAPWIDFDADLTLPSPADTQPIIHEQVISQALNASASKKKKNNAASSTHHSILYQDSPPISTRRERRKSGDFKGMTGYLSPGGSSSKTKDGSRKSIFVRSRNPMAKLFDGAGSTEDEGEDYFGNAMYEASPKGTPRSNKRRQHRSSSEPTTRVHSPIPVRPFSPDSPFRRGRRGAIYTDEDEGVMSTFPAIPTVELNSTASLALPKDDPFVEPPSTSVPTTVLMSLKKFISQPVPASPIGSDGATPLSPLSRPQNGEETGAAQHLRKAMGDGKDAQGKIMFKNPFSGMGSPMGRRKREQKQSSGVAPDFVV